jgi:8-oxo-dGTP pyrophosphatase MutT (NUDIX family)
VEAGRRPEVVLVEQFRGSVRGYIHEVPAGVVEEGEDPAACARRELEEETGYVAGRFRPLATLCPIPGTSAHRMYFYLAEDLAPGRQRLEEAECLTVKRVPLDDLVAAILDGPSSGTDTGKSPGAGAAPGALPGEADAPAAGRVVVIDAKTHLAVLHVALLRRGAGA